MHLAEDGITIANPFLTDYQRQELDWQRRERRFFCFICLAGFITGIVLWLAVAL